MIEPTNENIYPIGARLLVEAYKQAAQTSGGLELAQGDGYATSVFGEVLRAGDGARFKEGDVLMWRRYSLDSLKTYTEEGEQEYYLIDESEVIAQILDEVASKERYPQIKEKKDARQRSEKAPNEEEESGKSTS